MNSRALPASTAAAGYFSRAFTYVIEILLMCFILGIIEQRASYFIGKVMLKTITSTSIAVPNIITKQAFLYDTVLVTWYGR